MTFSRPRWHYLAYKDPRVPWYARIIAVCIVGYAFSPIDPIPDPLSVIGYLDDLILVPLRITIILKMIPKEVMNEYRETKEGFAQTIDTSDRLIYLL